MVREILIYPENKDILTKKSLNIADVNDIKIKELIQDLKDTLANTKGGCGISAIQIGEAKRICVLKYNNEFITLINPVITRKRGEVKFEEGCLSAPDYRGVFTRAQKVWCDYIDEEGNKKELAQGGLMSVIIQHELDHFDGWCNVFDLVKEKE